jgi:hypothetical protein
MAVGLVVSGLLSWPPREGSSGRRGERRSSSRRRESGLVTGWWCSPCVRVFVVGLPPLKKAAVGRGSGERRSGSRSKPSTQRRRYRACAFMALTRLPPYALREQPFASRSLCISIIIGASYGLCMHTFCQKVLRDEHISRRRP